MNIDQNVYYNILGKNDIIIAEVVPIVLIRKQG
jgi:hypothetical protein